MAGIGFELKKLFKGKGILSSIKAYAYSSLVSLGPFILAVIIIAVFLLLLNFLEISVKQKELFIATIVYAFIFSQVIASGFKMLITRFISDMLYARKFENILPSLWGLLSVVLPIAGIMAILFFINSPLSIELKLVSYLLFMELIIIFITMDYLSTLKDYMKIVKSFLAGVVTTILLALVFLLFTDIGVVFGLLLSMDMGFLVIISFLLVYLRKFFGKSSKNYYQFLKYFDKFSSLFFVSFFYTLGLYSHNFIFWTSELGVKIADTYVYAPIYDVPTFYAFLSIMPSMVIFVVSMETSFYEKYRAYYTLITGKGSFGDIEDARKDMSRVLWSEIRNIMELQTFFTLVFLAIGYYVLPRLGLIPLSMDIFNILVLGAFFNILLLIIILILLYFEDRKGAVFIALTFLITNAGFTYFTLGYSNDIYGTGFFVSTFISLVVALVELVVYLRNINYHTFVGQPVIHKENSGVFTRLVNAFLPKKDEKQQ